MLELAIEKRADKRAIFKLTGRLDASNATELRDVLKSAASSYAARIVIDMDGLEFIDSSGLSALISGLKAVREQKGGLALSGVGPQVKVALELTQLHKILPVFADNASALTSLD